MKAKTSLSILLVISLGFANCKKTDVSKSENQALSANGKTGTGKVLATTIYNVTPSTSLSTTFWDNVQASLATGPVDVVFADGVYTRSSAITISGRGHATNLLTLKTASTVGGASFTGNISSSLLSISASQNIKLLRLKFTGDKPGYAVSILDGQDITIENSRFVDMHTLTYGALGVHNTSNNVIVKNCTFSRIGTGAGAHMIYAANNTERLFIISNVFTDCSGSFIKFRNGTHRSVVYNNNFTSHGTYDITAQPSGPNPPFIQVSAINDVNPGDEHIADKFVVTANTFTFGTLGTQTNLKNLSFHVNGFSPADRNYWISSTQASTLNSGTVTQKRAVMSSELGLNGEYIHYGGNTNTNGNTDFNVSYGVWDGNFPNCNPSWQGTVSIGTGVNAGGMPTTEAEALAYYP